MPKIGTYKMFPSTDISNFQIYMNFSQFQNAQNLQKKNHIRSDYEIV